MSDLAKRLRPNIEAAPWVIEKVQKLEEELENEKARDIHSCHPNCSMPGCVNRRLRDRIEQLEAALSEWSSKTDWMQKSPNPQPKWLGKHRVDVLNELLKEKDAEVESLTKQRDSLQGRVFEMMEHVADVSVKNGNLEARVGLLRESCWRVKTYLGETQQNWLMEALTATKENVK